MKRNLTYKEMKAIKEYQRQQDQLAMYIVGLALFSLIVLPILIGGGA